MDVALLLSEFFLKCVKGTKKSLNRICVNDNYNDINKSFARVCRENRSVIKDRSKVKYKIF